MSHPRVTVQPLGSNQMMGGQVAVPPERQGEFIARLAAPEEQGDALLAELALASSAVETMQRVVVAAVTRRQDGRLSVD